MPIIPLIIDGAPPEWFIVELQGAISVKRWTEDIPEAALAAAKHSIDPSRENALELYGGMHLGDIRMINNKPWLRIGNALLEGKIITLTKPLLMFKKGKQTAATTAAAADDMVDVEAATSGERNGHNKTNQTCLNCVCIVRKKLLFASRPKVVVRSAQQTVS